MTATNSTFSIKYRLTIGGTITREFESMDRAETWCHQIGRPELIHRIVKTDYSEALGSDTGSELSSINA